MPPLLTLSGQVEEVSRRYAERHGLVRDDDWFLLKLQEELGELTHAYMRFSGRSKLGRRGAQEDREAIEAELADVVCHALLFARRMGLEVETAIERKWLKHLDA